MYRCQHAQPHTGELDQSPKEKAWRKFLDNSEWIRAGYCYLYYPEWLRSAWEKYDWNKELTKEEQ